MVDRALIVRALIVRALIELFPGVARHQMSIKDPLKIGSCNWFWNTKNKKKRLKRSDVKREKTR